MHRDTRDDARMDGQPAVALDRHPRSPRSIQRPVRATHGVMRIRYAFHLDPYRRGDDEEWELPPNNLIDYLPNYLRDPQYWGRPLRLAGLVLTILVFMVSIANAIYGRIDADCVRINAQGVAFYHDCAMLMTRP